ncbi:MAG: hypothetical protein ACLQU2_20835 [Candidatus Binataceae bacterium]
MARAKRRRNKSRAFRFFLLAGLTLLIAAFIARREIPFLMKSGINARPRPARGASENPQRLVRAGENHHSSLTLADEVGGASREVARSRDQTSSDSEKAPAGVETAGSERRQPGEELIKYRSR